jgi:hypothetical protein
MIIHILGYLQCMYFLIGVNFNMTTMKCKKCGEYLIFSGFDRKLITRGKNKGKYDVVEYYSCKNKCERNK